MTNIKDWPVMKKRCPTCPFNEKGDVQLRGTVEARALSASQICHHPRMHGKKEDHLCRGSRDFQLVLLYRMGMLDAPTDQAWDEKMKSIAKEKT